MGEGPSSPPSTSVDSVAAVVAFKGILAPSPDYRSSERIRSQPDADDLQMNRALREAKLHDIETSIGMHFNKNFLALSFNEYDILEKASQLGVSLGNNEKEVASSVASCLIMR